MPNVVNAKQLTFAIANSDPSQAILIRGPHGIGKSAMVKAAAMETNREFLDIRLGQMTEGDLLGIPFIHGDGSTHTTVPSWYQKAMDAPCVLFFDELNRALPTVMQGVFQIILDRAVQSFELHSGTLVVSAINNGSEYAVSEMDPALLDRFAVFDFKPTTAEFLEYAESRFDTDVYSFMVNNATALFEHHDIGDIAATPRSWEMADKVVKKLDVPPSFMLSSFLGQTLGEQLAVYLAEKKSKHKKVKQTKTVEYGEWKELKNQWHSKYEKEFEGDFEQFLIKRQQEINTLLKSMSIDNMLLLLDTAVIQAEKLTQSYVNDKGNEKIAAEFYSCMDDIRSILVAQDLKDGEIPMEINSKENKKTVNLFGETEKKPIKSGLFTEGFILSDDNDRVIQSPKKWLLPWGSVMAYYDKVKTWGDSDNVQYCLNISGLHRIRHMCEEDGQVDIIDLVDKSLKK